MTDLRFERDISSDMCQDLKYLLSHSDNSDICNLLYGISTLIKTGVYLLEDNNSQKVNCMSPMVKAWKEYLDKKENEIRK